MPMHDPPLLYWANSLFTEADREFNSHCAEVLRAAGYEVFLPQEAPANHDLVPTARAIFETDTRAVLNADALVACIDQETIDCGVASEIGLAYAYGIPIVGLYTDVRQFRSGPGRMYKNLYVVGAIERSGCVVGSIQDLLRALAELKHSHGFARSPEAQFDMVAGHYEQFVAKLESWYRPALHPLGELIRHVPHTPGLRVLELGCGPVGIGGILGSAIDRLTYVGVDTSPQMRELASRGGRLPLSHYLPPTDLDAPHLPRDFDFVATAFTLHDQVDPASFLAPAAERLAPAGLLAIMDLTPGDLPRLTDLLRCALVSPARAPERRLTATQLVALVDSLGFTPRTLVPLSTSVAFPDKESLLLYITTFGLHLGADLPLGIRNGDLEWSLSHMERGLDTVQFPFVDRREFLLGVFSRHV